MMIEFMVGGLQEGSRSSLVPALGGTRCGTERASLLNNSNLILTTTGGCGAVPGDANQVLCGTPVLTFGDRVSGCPFDDVTHAIGISETYTAGWANCAGWPTQANFDGNWWPDNVRAWVR